MDLLDISNILHVESFNKPTIKKTNKKLVDKPVEKKNLDDINAIDYMNKTVDLSKYKLPELKQLAKKYRLHVTGTKPIIIGRIDKYFRESYSAIKIQKTFRAFLVIKFIILKGDGFKNHSLCNNDTDFITLEPLSEIPRALFFSYSDKKSFTYGFNAASIVQSLKTNIKLNNPYNREKMDEQTILKAISVYKIARILFPDLKSEYETYQSTPSTQTRTTRQYANHNNANHNNANHNNANMNNNINYTYRPALNANYINNNPDEHNRYNAIQEKRNRTITQRINNLFTELDQLGNYTQISWFTDLDRTELIRLYRGIYDIWYYRGQLTYQVRQSISPFHEPFNSVFNGNVSQNNVTFDQIKLAVLIVMETLVYSGIDEDYRKIGAFHLLTGLTLVSRSARDALPWLYESLI